MRRTPLLLVGLFVLALFPRLYGALTFGVDLDGPGTFQLINFDEGGSCRAYLGDFTYPTFMGRQVVAIASALGRAPTPEVVGGNRPRGYCHSAALIAVQRVYTSVLGALSVVLVSVMALLLWPSRPQVALTAGWLMAFSSFHVSESHWATADVPQLFFILLFMTALTWALRAGKGWAVALTPVLLVAAVWTKWWAFALFSYAALLYPLPPRRRLLIGSAIAVGALGIGLWIVGVADVVEVLQRRSVLLWGNETSRFGTGYAHIGTWRRWIRNVVNVPIFHFVALGLPACLFILAGLRGAWRDGPRRLYLVHASVLVYLAYMLVLGPVTYYRYYLPLLPTAALLAAYGFWQSRFSARPLLVALFLLYPVLLTVDSEYNFRHEPRREFRDWLAKRPQARMYTTFYVNPPAGSNAGLFDPDTYARVGPRYIAAADYLVLSENWYDTAFANELNGPIAWNPEWLIKTKPEYARMYRRILAGRDRKLVLEAEFGLQHLMPEFLLHRFFYGSFPLFIGDLKVFRVVTERS